MTILLIENLNGLNIKAWSGNTRSGFKHTCEVCGGVFAQSKINYYNRTWEKYTFQSVIISALNKALEEAKKSEKKAQNESDKAYYLNAQRRIKRALKTIENNQPKKAKTINIDC